MKDRLQTELERIEARRKLGIYYPVDGPLRRELYPKHLEFFAAGNTHRERCMLAANRVGKTEGVGGYELTLHLTGLYPTWWEGKRFTRPIRAWACGDTARTVRDILQDKLLGPPGRHGTGLIPGDRIHKTTPKQGVPDAVETIQVVWRDPARREYSVVQLKSYETGRESFQGTEQDMIWLDEEPPIDVYSECLMRTMTTDGLVMCTFTPLNGITEVVQMFLPELSPT